MFGGPARNAIALIIQILYQPPHMTLSVKNGASYSCCCQFANVQMYSSWSASFDAVKICQDLASCIAFSTPECNVGGYSNGVETFVDTCH
jgi:hypothetical protein